MAVMNSENDNLGMSQNEEAAADWCMRLFDGPLNPDEKAEFEHWMSTSPHNALLFQRMVGVLHHTNAIADMPGFLALRAEALAAMDQAAEEPQAATRPSRRGVAAACLALLICVLGALGVWQGSAPDVYATAIGERRSIRLADGSSVSLDADSQISVTLKDDRRMIVLDRGRAKFDVAKDPLRPFSVTAGTQAVVATGTSFSVELLKDQLRVLLYEGKVDVLPQRSLSRATKKDLPYHAAASLTPGQELIATLTSGAGRIIQADTHRAMSWEEGRLDFTNISLANAVERFNRYATTPIVIEDAAAGQKIINGVFDAGDVNSFILGVTSLYDLSLKNDGQFIYIKFQRNEHNK
jgi:transmembrane sensor